MSTLLLNKEKKRIIIYILFSIVFSTIYESFSHNVISLFMCLVFIFPLCLLIEDLIIIRKKIHITNTSHNLFKACIFTFTIYFIILGVLEIYGTTNKLVIIYPLLGFSLLILSIIIYKKD